MKLLKVTVPNFRNLKDVELTFEPGLQPSVFPISSENGGGKSTLLQLIFILLHCSLDKNRYVFIKNLISSLLNCSLAKEELVRLASFHILKGDTEVDLVFDLIESDFAKESEKYQQIWQLAITKIKKERAVINKKELEERLISVQHYLTDLGNEKSTSSDLALRSHESSISRLKKRNSEMERVEKTKKDIISKLRKLDDVIEIYEDLIQGLLEEESLNNGLIHCLFLKGTTAKHGSQENKDYLLVCTTTNTQVSYAMETLKVITESIFLAAPPTQPYLFMSELDKRSLLSNSGEYETKLRKLNERLPNLYIYNQLAVSEIIGVFKNAREKDWEKVTKTLEYGNEFQTVVHDFQQFLGKNKSIYPSKELDHLEVRQVNSEGDQIKLSPEDLSHGELKRLGLYAWIKYNNINDSIVLIDEIENGLHPDWQYNIVRDLAEWGDNQYLLATHSFHLCEALTPKHVKEIEPKMVNPSIATEGQE